MKANRMTNDFANYNAYSQGTFGIRHEKSKAEFSDCVSKESWSERKRRRASFVRHFWYLYFLSSSDVFMFVQ